MAQPRRFDWDEAKRLYEEGWTKAALCRRYGVSNPSISRAVDLRMRAAQKQRLEELTAAVCEDCGGPCTKNWYSGLRLDRVVCFACSQVRRREEGLLARLDEYGAIHCCTCGAYRSILEYRMVRGYPFKRCRGCETAKRKEYRQSHRVEERAYDRVRKRRQRELAKEMGDD